MSERRSDQNSQASSPRNPAAPSGTDGSPAGGTGALGDPASAMPRAADAPDAESPQHDDSLGTAPVRRGRPSVAEAEALSGRILDASWDVLLAGGFESFTFDRVARHAHIGKATIYSRFPHKGELMRALLLRRIELRSDDFKAAGSNLPIEDAFQLRAANTIKSLFAPGGTLVERLIDWLEQETGEGLRMRAQAYRDAVDSIGASLLGSGRLGSDRQGTQTDTVFDPGLAARLWLEGLIGHAKLAYTEGASSTVEIERWASDYTRFFFAGLRAMVAD